MFNFETSSIRVMTSIIFSTIKNHPFVINCSLIVQYLPQKIQTYVLFTKNLVRFDKIIQYFSKNYNFIGDCEFGGPHFNTSELNQVRSILDFLREQQKRR